MPTALRDAGRVLSPWRDVRALIDSCDAIAAKLDDPATRRLLRATRADLTRRHRELRSSAPRALEVIARARARLTRMLEAARRWPTGPLDATLLAAGAARIYRRGRQALAAGRRKRTAPTLHEWRKQSKYLAEGLASLGGGRGLRIDALAEKMALLATTLGDDHDLHLLHAHLNAGTRATVDPDPGRVLVRIIEKRRRKLERRAFACGKSVFDCGSRAFQAKLGKALLRRL